MRYAFEGFFKTATGYSPYPYQKELANGKIPDMLSAPTGAGKTEAAVLCMWLWRRLNDDSRQKTPRRLVYCLPMRTLVEQTRKRVNGYIERLDLDESIKPRVITLMGGSVDRDYSLYPEDDAIIIGTQDMLLSRALNRGYAANPFRWPVEFGLLNNDCMWIMDEVQLMHSTGQSNPLTPTKNTQCRLASQSGIANGFGLSKKGSALRKICIVSLQNRVFLTRIRSGYQVALEPVAHLAL